MYATPIIGSQWVKAKPGSKFKLDCVITENATDRDVPVSAKLQSVQLKGADARPGRAADRAGIGKRFNALAC